MNILFCKLRAGSTNISITILEKDQQRKPLITVNEITKRTLNNGCLHKTTQLWTIQ